MKSSAPIAVAFREVRHEQPDDCLHCEAIAVRNALHQGAIPEHRHEGLHQFQWLAAGTARVRLDGRAIDVVAPAAFSLPPGCVHAFQHSADAAGLQVTVPAGLLARAFDGAPALSARLALPQCLSSEEIGHDAGTGARLFQQLADEFAQALPGRIEALHAHAVLLATWFLRQRAQAGGDERRQALRDTLVQRFRALLALHLRREHALAFYAGALQVTPDHLSRACRAVTGLSAQDLLHERLTAEARRRLAASDAAVGAVATELGYADAAYFSRFFSRRTGLSPQAFRLAVLRGEAAAD